MLAFAFLDSLVITPLLFWFLLRRECKIEQLLHLFVLEITLQNTWRQIFPTRTTQLSFYSRWLIATIVSCPSSFVFAAQPLFLLPVFDPNSFVRPPELDPVANQVSWLFLVVCWHSHFPHKLIISGAHLKGFKILPSNEPQLCSQQHWLEEIEEFWKLCSQTDLFKGFKVPENLARHQTSNIFLPSHLFTHPNYLLFH